MDFPTIHTNFWDAVIGVPVVLIVTQLIKWLFHPKSSMCRLLLWLLACCFQYLSVILIILLPGCLWDIFMDTPQLAAMPVLKQRGERLEKIRHLIHQTKKTATYSLVLIFTTYFFCS